MARLSVPPLPEGFIPRQRLQAALAGGFSSGRRVTLIKAGPGEGKTTLVASYVRGRTESALWYGTSPSDGDPVYFFGRLFERFRAVGGSEQPGEILRTLGEAGLERAVLQLCEDLEAAGPVIIVLDDAHNLPQALPILADAFPSESQLIVAGRSIPGFRLTQMRISGEALVLDEADLRFTDDDLAAWLGPDAPPAEVADLARRTHGWAAGLAFASSWKADLGSAEHVYAYIADEIFAALPEILQRQLLQCSYLPRLSLAPCRELLGADAPGFLKSLAGHPNLARRTGNDEWEFQPLFRDFLQREMPLRWPEEGRAELFRKLAYDAGMPAEQAISFLQMAGAWQEAEDRLVAEAPALFQEGRLETLRNAAEGFPASWRRGSAWLAYLRGEAERRQGRLDAAQEALIEADALVCGGPAGAWIATSLAAVHGARGQVEAEQALAERALAAIEASGGPLGQCLNVLGLNRLARGRLAEAQECLTRAQGHFVATADLAGQARVQHNLGLLFARQGDFPRACAHYREAIRLSEAGGLMPLALTFNNLALCELYSGNIDRAWKALEKGMALAERLASARDRAFLLRTLGHLEQANGTYGAAREHYEQALAESTCLGDLRSQVHAQLGLARVALASGDPAAALEGTRQALAQLGGAREAQDGQLVVTDDADPDLVEPLTVMAEIHLAAGRTRVAESCLDTLEALLERHPSTYQRLQVGILRGRLEGQGAAPRAAGAGAAFVIRCFGVSGAELAGHEVEWRSRNSRLVLGFLLMHPEGATKDTLTDLLYGGSDTSRSTVHVAISRLRSALEPDLGREPSRLVLFQEGRYVFNRAAQVQVDAWEFRQAVRQAAAGSAGREAALERALALYLGPFLADFSEVPWVQEQQEHFRRLATDAFEAGCGFAAATDDWGRVEALADRHLNLDPLCVPAYRARVVALAMRERGAEALLAAELAARRLEQDVGILPEDLAEVAEAVREGSLTVRKARAFLGV